MSDTLKRALILTADAGFGHRSAANAIAAAITERYGDRFAFEIVNPLEDKRTPFFLRDSQTDYDKIVRNVPELYRLGYEASDAPFPATIVESALTVMLYEVIYDIIHKYQPDVIVTTYPLYQVPISAIYMIKRIHIPFYTVVTDLATVHRIWFEKNVDGCLVPTPVVHDLAINCGLSEDHVVITGIPVNPELGKIPADRGALRRSLGWHPDLLTFLAVGSRRVENMVSTLRTINHYGAPLQLVVVTGNDQEQYDQLMQEEWHIPVQLFIYSSNLAPFMLASDAIICKAGGLVVTESLACGLPMLLIDIIPGQETGNAEYVVDGGAGVVVANQFEMVETLTHWLMHDQRELKLKAEHARNLGKADAAYKVADIVWRGAQIGRTRLPQRLYSTRLSLTNLLNRYDVHWE